MSSTNSNEGFKVFSLEEKIDVLLEAVIDLSTEVELLREELSEKISNLSLEGSAYGIELIEES